MPAPLVPATLAFAPDGTPYSEQYGDVYHSAAGGPAQARHVFLAGNGLPGRWRGRRGFSVLETGFGFGLNFLATWAAWREDVARCERLHFVSLEKHPFVAADLERLHARYPEFAECAAALRAAWPPLVPGVHRLELERGRVVLTLAFADAADALRELRLAADAIYLDGFAPAKNPAMWSAAALKALARLAAPGATAATWSAAAPVREALAAAGFAAEKRPGYAAKREMLAARYAPRGSTRAAPAPWPARRALVIGAGIAGSALCERLAARGWEVVLIERRREPGAETSGNHAGVFHPVATPDDSVLARLTRAGSLYALSRWAALEGAAWAPSGALQLARDADEDEAQQRALAALGAASDYARRVTRAEASDLAGVGVAAGGLWFAPGGWARPPSLARAQLAHSTAEACFGIEVAALEPGAGGWTARDAAGHAIASAPLAVLANAADALRLAPGPDIALRRVRGQVSYLPAARFHAPRLPLLRGGFVLPAVDGVAVAGASYDFDDDDPAPRLDSHAGNLERLERIVPGAARGLDPAALEGRVGFRAVTRDRLPVVGELAPGLYGAFGYGSRGLVWAALAAELIASLVEREPLPLEGKLADALAPARFKRRRSKP
ncbi:MAG TPA: bifunctional tRNA (5-methylaminomethyl-2-thiouridine)(34)-methyltransferase MnmD/FAD-dependent 5-carboxymethylaminomethyl-2-thiouridine(34) oxidoreductase MnmC [Burkholderiales bacterium]|nr:bifunctional tRNA (5-methylaminomethyl-2-thiouridine)(34)-methyltransferase MnmD/FAD-dependent 5-carboxymethylaminomethyl-2-thiouridine(34) oxidoreductase MnmC [Burkholderiales bacterium]